MYTHAQTHTHTHTHTHTPTPTPTPTDHWGGCLGHTMYSHAHTHTYTHIHKHTLLETIWGASRPQYVHTHTHTHTETETETGRQRETEGRKATNLSEPSPPSLIPPQKSKLTRTHRKGRKLIFVTKKERK